MNENGENLSFSQGDRKLKEEQTAGRGGSER